MCIRDRSTYKYSEQTYCHSKVICYLKSKYKSITYVALIKTHFPDHCDYYVVDIREKN